MIERHPFEDLGRFENDWLSARHHFSFGSYLNPKRMGFGPLRVWNDDTIQPGEGFDLHGHRDMEIITYVHEGAIWHRDHLGNEGITKAGDVQVMTAGKGILHAEYNRGSDPTKIFQIWIEPSEIGLTPRWETRAFPIEHTKDGLLALASGSSSAGGALQIHQDATLFGGRLRAGETVTHILAEGRRAYFVATRGGYRVNEKEIEPRDGVSVINETNLVIEALGETELVLADLPRHARRTTTRSKQS